MAQNRLAMRSVTIAVDLGNIHGNSDRPMYYTAWLCIPDTCLGPRGAGHRANRKDEHESLKPTSLSDFASSDLFRLQGFPPNQVPQALNESDFSIPTCKTHLQCNDTRKNLTDHQETAQWVAGEAIFSQLLESVLGPEAKVGTSFSGLLVIMYPN